MGEPMGSLGSTELIIVLIIVLVLFGGAKLPKLARSIGQAKNELDHSMRDHPDHETADESVT